MSELEVFLSWCCLGFAVAGLFYYLYLIVKEEINDYRK